MLYVLRCVPDASACVYLTVSGSPARVPAGPCADRAALSKSLAAATVRTLHTSHTRGCWLCLPQRLHRYEDRVARQDFEDYDRLVAYAKQTPYVSDTQPVNAGGRPEEERLTRRQWKVLTGFNVADPVASGR